MASKKSPKITGGLLTELFQGAPDGMSIALPPDEIALTQDRYLQDVLVDKPGRRRRRGPVQNASGLATLTRQAWGIVQTQDPSGAVRLLVLNGTGVNAMYSLLSADLTTIAAEINVPSAPGSINPAPAVNVSPCLNGGVLIGIANTGYGPQPGANVSLTRWYGANKANYNTGTVTFAKGSTSVTGAGTSWMANVVPGMFLNAQPNDDTFSGIVGIVQTVNSNTSITLTSPALESATTKSYILSSLSSVTSTKVFKGTLTCSSSHAHIHGGDTKWLTQLAANMLVFRLRDFAFVGTVSSVQSDFAATIGANAAVDCADDPYVAFLPKDGSPATYLATSTPLGFVTAIYAGRQWYANNPVSVGLFGGTTTPRTSRVWFSDPSDPEAVDTTIDGDWFDVFSSSPSTNPIVALTPTANALLVHKQTEIWGIFGTEPENFSARQLDSEGCVDAGSVQDYEGGALWAGRQGIKYFNGTSVSNLTLNSLGKYWTDIVKSFDSTQYRMQSMIARNHYFLFIEHCTGPVSVVKGASSTTPSRLTVCINLLTSALTMSTNVDIRGAVKLTTFLAPTTYYIVNDSSIGHICSADDLFDVIGADAITCTGNVAGPDWYVETRAHDGGDPTRVKRWRWLETNSLVQGDVINVDAVLGLSQIDQALPNPILTSSFYGVDNRVWIDWDDQLLALRFWQNSSSVTNVDFGPYTIAFKYQRTGRPH